MATQILLLKDVESLGRCGDIVKVKPGFARNFIVPKGKGVFADKGTIRMQARLQEERQKQASSDRKDAEVLAKRLEELTVETHVKVDQDGHMYGSVTVADIVQLLSEKHQVSLEKKSILLKGPIKTLGVHTISCKLDEGVEANFALSILEEGK